MSSPAQILANRSNAQASTGPVTPEGKAAVSRNSTKLGLFSAAAFVRPEEQSIFDELSQSFMAELCPESALEHTLVREIAHASWRLRRCALVESNLLQDGTVPDIETLDLDRLQASIDRARATAQRTLHRGLAEFRRLRSDPPPAPRAPDLACWEAELHRGLAELKRTESAALPGPEPAQPDSAKQSQSTPAAAPAVIPMIARNAPCPCGSREKYKRCCGKSAPPVLGALPNKLRAS